MIFLLVPSQSLRLPNDTCLNFKQTNINATNIYRKLEFLDDKKLLGEVGHDIRNYRCRGLSYLLKPKAEAGSTDTRFAG